MNLVQLQTNGKLVMHSHSHYPPFHMGTATQELNESQIDVSREALGQRSMRWSSLNRIGRHANHPIMNHATLLLLINQFLAVI